MTEKKEAPELEASVPSLRTPDFWLNSLGFKHVIHMSDDISTIDIDNSLLKAFSLSLVLCTLSAF